MGLPERLAGKFASLPEEGRCIQAAVREALDEAAKAAREPGCNCSTPLRVDSSPVHGDEFCPENIAAAIERLKEE